MSNENRIPEDPLWLGKLQAEGYGLKLTNSQALIWEVIDESRTQDDLIEYMGTVKKPDLIAAILAYEQYIADNSDLFNCLAEKFKEVNSRKNESSQINLF